MNERQAQHQRDAVGGEFADLEAEDRDTDKLVVRIGGGDQQAIATLYSRYFARVHAYLRVALRDPDAAEDATQKVFVKALEALPHYERRAPFRAWLFTIARNHTINALKARERVDVVDPSVLDRARATEMTDPELQVLGWVTDTDLLVFVDRLPLAQRQVLLLRYMLDLSTAQIADVLGRSPEDVRTLQSRALAFLRARLTALGRAPVRDCPRMRRCPRQAPVLRARRFALQA